ncbi:MAG: hypothetical protein WKF58_02655 [Ilumatobacteraceae bacterium]
MGFLRRRMRDAGWQWRDLPTGLVMIAPSALVLGAFLVYPLVKTVSLGRQRCNESATRCVTTGWDQYSDVWRSEEFQQALWVTGKFTLLVVPIGPRARHRPRDARRPLPARHRHLPCDLLLHRGHVGRRGEPHVVLLAAARRRRHPQHRLGGGPVRRREGAGTAARPGHRARRRWRCPACGQGSASRSSS